MKKHVCALGRYLSVSPCGSGRGKSCISNLRRNSEEEFGRRERPHTKRRNCCFSSSLNDSSACQKYWMCGSLAEQLMWMVLALNRLMSISLAPQTERSSSCQLNMKRNFDTTIDARPRRMASACSSNSCSLKFSASCTHSRQFWGVSGVSLPPAFSSTMAPLLELMVKRAMPPMADRPSSPPCASASNSSSLRMLAVTTSNPSRSSRVSRSPSSCFHTAGARLRAR
mmetsp:Transcript_46128/g.116159  ORF Transcript_46128/g.116159 Transcript_46128/m.116159 type:complete len:226 (-) Transcript_46128:2473-3150(-)